MNFQHCAVILLICGHFAATEPSPPRVRFLPTSNHSIQINIWIETGVVNTYQISSTSAKAGSSPLTQVAHAEKQNATTYEFNSTLFDPGTCFNFTILAISGSGQGSSKNDSVVVFSDICYKPSKPRVRLVSTTDQSIQMEIGKGNGITNGFEITTTSANGLISPVVHVTIAEKENASSYVFNNTLYEPGTCFNFTILAISGSEPNASKSDSVFSRDICYKPSKPRVRLVSTTDHSIQMEIGKGNGITNGFEITTTSANDLISPVVHVTIAEKENASSYVFNNTLFEPGTCFNFTILAISGSEPNASKSDSVFSRDICYKPSKPRVRLVSTTDHSIQMEIGKGNGITNGFEITTTSANDLISPVVHVTIAEKENASSYVFNNTLFEPGTCFNFTILAISGSEPNASKSDSVFSRDICYKPSKPRVRLVSTTDHSIQMEIGKGNGITNGFEITTTSANDLISPVVHVTIAEKENASSYVFNNTLFEPGTCFNFTILAISGSEPNASKSDSVFSRDICYKPSKPRVRLVSTTDHSIQMEIGKGNGITNGFEITTTSANDLISPVVHVTIAEKENASSYVFNNTLFEPGTCFNFTILAISGSEPNASKSDSVFSRDICYKPSKPRVRLVSTTDHSIQMEIGKGNGITNGFEITTTSANDLISPVVHVTIAEKENASSYVFNNTLFEPGTCFNFTILAISGSEPNASKSDSVFSRDICYKPSKPRVRLVSTTDHSIQMEIGKGNGITNGFEITTTSANDLISPVVHVTIAEKENASSYVFNNTLFEPGTCFNFTILAISGSEPNASKSDSVFSRDICYKPSKPRVRLVSTTDHSIQMEIGKGNGITNGFEITTTSANDLISPVVHVTIAEKENASSYVFNNTLFEPGTCFNFTILAISGSEPNASKSDSVFSRDICYKPSKPRVRLVSTTDHSIQMEIGKGNGITNGFEITTTSANDLISPVVHVTIAEKENASSYVFNNTLFEPGTCFNFTILAISGSEPNASKSDSVFSRDICYKPSKPRVRLVSTTDHSIQMEIGKGNGITNGFEITTTSANDLISPVVHVTIAEKENASSYVFNNTLFEPGTCFNFTILAISGSEPNASKSDSVFSRDICYKPSKPRVRLVSTTDHSIQMEIGKGNGITNGFEITTTSANDLISPVVHVTIAEKENASSYVFNNTLFEPGTCFNFTILAISGSEPNASKSDSVFSRDICYKPSKPRVRLVSTTDHSIQMEIGKGNGITNGFEITTTSANDLISPVVHVTIAEKENASSYVFNNTLYEPGTCFNFTILAISGSEPNASKSDSVFSRDICYKPSKPRVRLVSTTDHSIQMEIGKGNGITNGFEITTTSSNGLISPVVHVTIAEKENASSYVFNNTLYEPGTCFNFTILAISGSEPNASKSDSVFSRDICYTPSTPIVTFRQKTTRSIEFVATQNSGTAASYHVTGIPGSGNVTHMNLSSTGNITSFNFTTNDPSGTCFTFHIAAISGSDQLNYMSQIVEKVGICYRPSAPEVKFRPTTTDSIEIVITKGNGIATSYCIIATPVNGNFSSNWSGSFPAKELSATLNVTTKDEPGTCFNFQVMSISGLGEGAGMSEYVKSKVCYKMSQDQVELDTKKIDVQFSISVNLPFSDELTIKNSFKYKNLSSSFQRELTNAYIDVPGFLYIEILGFKPGSIIAEYKAFFEAFSIDQSLTFVNTSVVENLKKIHIASAVVDQTYLTAHMATTLTNAASELKVNGFCGLIQNPCPFGYECKSNSLNEPFCIAKCRSLPLFCGNNGQCFIDYKTNQMKCQCLSTEREYYYGDKCEYMGTQLPCSLAFTAKDYAIIGGASAAGVLLIIIFILVVRFMRRGPKKSKGKETDDEEKSDLSVTERSVRMSLKDMSAFDNRAKAYNSGMPGTNKNRRIYRDPQTGEEAIIYQTTDVSRSLSRGPRDLESVQNEQPSRHSLYEYIDADNLYKIKRPNLHGTKNWLFQ